MQKNSRYPVVTLVLYFGHEKHWSQPLRLKECLDIPPEFEPYVNDYRINLFEIAYLTQEQVALFQSDFRIVADYFVQKREKGGIHNMCDVLDRIELKGRREGRQEGRREGELKAKKEMALSLAGMGISVEKIAEAAKVSIEVVKQWITSDGNAAR